VRLQGICVVLAMSGIAATTAPAAFAKKAKASDAGTSSGGAVYTPPAAPAAAPTPAVASVPAPAPPAPAGATGATTSTGATGTTGLSIAAQLELETGGQAAGQPDPALTQTVPGNVAVILPDGLAAAPLGAPLAVRNAIFAANAIVGLPYIYGGGHASFTSSGYDCSGTVSYALHGAGLIKTPMNSSDFMSWGQSGLGQWITIYTNPSHVYMNIAGIRLDTSRAGDPSGLPGPEWRPVLTSNAHFHRRYVPGL
jgi:cell wall-associated NlpC family hydrolase